MKQRTHQKDELPRCLKKLGISLPQASKTKGKEKLPQTLGKDEGTSTYREDFKDFSDLKMRNDRWHQFDVANMNAHGNQGVPIEVIPSSPLTTTFRSSYRGEHGAPALSCRPKWSAQPPHKPGPSGYSIEFAAKPLKRRSPPPTKTGNVLDTYPSNVLLPYTRPEQVVTVWKPFPVLPPVKHGIKTSVLLDLLSKESYSSTYRQDYVR